METKHLDSGPFEGMVSDRFQANLEQIITGMNAICTNLCKCTTHNFLFWELKKKIVANNMSGRGKRCHCQEQKRKYG